MQENSDSLPHGGAFDAVRQRRSFSKVTDEAPTHDELIRHIEVLSSLPDHSGLRPWRIIELRGDSRDLVGRGIAEADAAEQLGADANTDPKLLAKLEERYLQKAHRAPLLLAIVVSPKPSRKVPEWEQEAVASGAAHLLSLLLHEAGWGTIWRTGTFTRTEPVHRAHQLDEGEYLLGWLYVGGIPEKDRKAKPRKPLDIRRHLSSL